jgi:hypothetical protein
MENLMDAKEFKATLKALGLKQTSFAAATGYSVQGIAKWVKHDMVPAWVPRWFLGYCYEGDKLPDEWKGADLDDPGEIDFSATSDEFEAGEALRQQRSIDRRGEHALKLLRERVEKEQHYIQERNQEYQESQKTSYEDQQRALHEMMEAEKVMFKESVRKERVKRRVANLTDEQIEEIMKKY